MNFEAKINEKLGILSNLVAKAKADGRGLTEEEQELYNETESEVTSLENALKNEQKIIARKEALKQAMTPLPVNTSGDNVVVGDNLGAKKPWDSFGQFLSAVADANNPSKMVLDDRLESSMIKNASGASVGVGKDGGFMVGTQYVNKVMDSVMDESLLLKETTRIPIKEGNNGISVPTLAESSRADGSRWGGIRSYWTSEAGTATSSKPTFGELTLKLSKLLAFVYATDELLQDAGALETWIMQKLPLELSFKADDAIINGDGNGKPLGIINSDALVSVAKETSQIADTIVWENIKKMWVRLPARSRKNSVWLIGQDAESQLFGLEHLIKNVAGSENVGGVPVYIPGNSAAGQPYGTLMGRPVKVIEQCPTVGDVGDIILADMSDYLVIDKGGITADTSIHVQFLYDEQTFRFRYRMNGAPYTSSTVGAYSNSNFEMSPYIAVAARA